MRVVMAAAIPATRGEMLVSYGAGQRGWLRVGLMTARLDIALGSMHAMQRAGAQGALEAAQTVLRYLDAPMGMGAPGALGLMPRDRRHTLQTFAGAVLEESMRGLDPHRRGAGAETPQVAACWEALRGRYEDEEARASQTRTQIQTLTPTLGRPSPESRSLNGALWGGTGA